MALSTNATCNFSLFYTNRFIPINVNLILNPRGREMRTSQHGTIPSERGTTASQRGTIPPERGTATSQNGPYPIYIDKQSFLINV